MPLPGELLPCPFCGGEAKFVSVNVPDNWTALVRVECQGCLTRSNAATLSDACTAWNLRSTPSGEGTRTIQEWRTMESAPGGVIGTRILAVVEGRAVVAVWGKESHVPWFGWILETDEVEDANICQPTGWMPMPPTFHDGAPAPSEWRTMESAPKDGTRIIVVGPNGNVWCDVKWEKMRRVPDRWSSFVAALPFEPTHWMPLPAAPSYCEANGPHATPLAICRAALAATPTTAPVTPSEGDA